jgi:hypothetical protein
MAKHNQIDITVDTQIMVHGSTGDEVAIRLLCNLRDDSYLRLAFDTHGRIQAEYGKKMDAGRLGMQVVKFLLSCGRVVFCEAPYSEWRRVNPSLDEVHFDKSDRPFVRTAMNATGSVLVAEEQHYSNAVRTVISKKTDVRVLSCAEAVAEFCEPHEDCGVQIAHAE